MRVVVLIDGGHARVLAKKAKRKYDADLVERMGHASVISGETLIRILYYDCAPYKGTVRKPVSGDTVDLSREDTLLTALAAKDLIAVRRGVLKFRGFKPKKIPIASEALTDDDFVPDFEQKGVDMRIGLDIANFSNLRSVDRIVLLTNDTDCIPAMKHARISGLQIVLVRFEQSQVATELLAHTDYQRLVDWP